MKSLIRFCAIFLTVLALVLYSPLLHAQVVDSTGAMPGFTASGLPVNWFTYLSWALAAYEMIVRLVPTVNNYSIVSRAFKFMAWLIHANNLKAN